MDRQMVYPGSIPLDTDLLNIQRNVMTAIGSLARAVLGDGSLVDGMPCVPGGGGDYTVTVGPGTCCSMFARDDSAFGSLAADLTPLMQVAALPGSTVLRLGGPPLREQVVCWLIQAAVGRADVGDIALPYWNAANPSVPFTGPNNSGLPQSTQRVVRVTLSAKPSAPQVFPIGVPPPPDPGWIPLYAVTTFWEKPQIDVGDIVEVAGAPTLRFPLSAMPPGPSRQDIITLNTLWRAPPRVRQVKVRLVGAGGGGAGGAAEHSGGGGGAGGYAEAFVPVSPGALYNIVVGAGGPGAPSGNTGGAGGDTAFDSFVRATGGQGGSSLNPDSHGGAPGLGIVGTFLQGGGYGGHGSLVADVPGGYGGASAFGGGGRGSEDVAWPEVGLASGSGGGGGYGSLSLGAQGGHGLVVIEY